MNDRFEEFKDRIEDAAIQAEFETGEREETVEEAKSHALVRVARMTLGFIVVIVGIAALPLPGPGWLIIAGGLTILSKDVAWAERLLRYIRKRVPGIPEDGKIPRSSMVTMAFVTLAAVSASLWWTFGRGSDDIQAGTYVALDVLDPVASAPINGAVTALDFGDEGPLTLTAEGCGPLEFAVTDRSKERFSLGELNDSTEGCDASAERLVAAMSGSDVSFHYETDGIVKWFFADNTLAAITVPGTAGAGDWRIELEGSE